MKRKQTNRIIFHSSLAEFKILKVLFHKIILGSGRIFKGIDFKDESPVGHEDSMHVCFRSDFNKNKPTTLQIETAGGLFHQLSRAYDKELKLEFHKPGRFFSIKNFLNEMVDYNPFV